MDKKLDKLMKFMASEAEANRKCFKEALSMVINNLLSTNDKQRDIIATQEGAEPEAIETRIPITRQAVKAILSKSLCNMIQLGSGDNRIQIHTPLWFLNGDPCMIYLEEISSGYMRLTDGGHTLMHLSYENTGNSECLANILDNRGIQENDGELFIDFPSEILGPSIMRFGQAISMVSVLAERGA